MANAPIFGFHSGQLGRGIVGGPLMSMEELAEKTTQAALRLLRGEPAADIKVPIQVPGSGLRLARASPMEHPREPPPGRQRRPLSSADHLAALKVADHHRLVDRPDRSRTRRRAADDPGQRRRAEHALRESEERFRLLADSAPAMVWLSGPDGRRADFNRGWLEFTGRTIEQEGGIDGWLDGVHPGDFAHTLQACSQAFDRREHFRIEYRSAGAMVSTAGSSTLACRDSTPAAPSSATSGRASTSPTSSSPGRRSRA